MNEIVNTLKKKGINIEPLPTYEENQEDFILNGGQYAVSLHYGKMGVDVDLLHNERFGEEKDSYEWLLIANEYFPNAVYHKIHKFLEDILFGK